LAELGNVLLAQAKQSEGTRRQALLMHASANYASASKLSETATTYNNWGISLYQQAKLSVILSVKSDGKEEANAFCRDAEQKFKKAIQLESSLREAFYNLGNVLFEIAGMTEDLAESVALYSKAIEQFENENIHDNDVQRSIDIQINSAVCLMKLASSDNQKEGSTEESLKLYETACSKFSNAAASDPYRADALLNWGVALANQANLLALTEAGDMYMAACDKFSSALDVDSKLYDALFNWGNVLAQHASKMPPGEATSAVLENAADKYCLFVEANPGHVAALTNWALSLYKDAQMRLQISHGNYDGVLRAEELLKTAEAKLRQVLTVKPREYDATVNLGLVLTARAELRAQTHEADTLYNAAGECYRKASCRSPRLQAAFVNWGLFLHSKAKRYVGHEAYLLCRSACSKHRVAVELGATDALVNWGHTLLAMSSLRDIDVKQRRDTLVEAQQRYKEAVTASPTDCRATKCLGDAFFLLGELETSQNSTTDGASNFYDTAMKHYTSAKGLYPEIDIALLNRIQQQGAEKAVTASQGVEDTEKSESSETEQDVG